MNRDILHAITEAQICQYEQDGAVCIRGQFDADWCRHMLAVREANIADPAGRLREVNKSDNPARFYITTYMSRNNPEFESFILNSPAAQIAAGLMRQDTVRFNMTRFLSKNLAPGHPRNGTTTCRSGLLTAPISRRFGLH